MEPFSQSSLQGGAKSTDGGGGGSARRVSVPRYMPSDYRISSPPLELLLTPTRPDTTPCFRVLLRLSALSDRTTMEEKGRGEGDKSFRITPSSPPPPYPFVIKIEHFRFSISTSFFTHFFFSFSSFLLLLRSPLSFADCEKAGRGKFSAASRFFFFRQRKKRLTFS